MNLKKIRRGDIIRHRGTGDSYVIIRTEPVILAVRDVEVTNADEWELVSVSARLPRYVPELWKGGDDA